MKRKWADLPPGAEERATEFKVAWAQRLERPLPELFPSKLHRHDETCWSEPYYTTIPATAWINVRVRRCKVTGGIQEMPVT